MEVVKWFKIFFFLSESNYYFTKVESTRKVGDYIYECILIYTGIVRGDEKVNPEVFEDFVETHDDRCWDSWKRCSKGRRHYRWWHFNSEGWWWVSSLAWRTTRRLFSGDDSLSSATLYLSWSCILAYILSLFLTLLSSPPSIFVSNGSSELPFVSGKNKMPDKRGLVYIFVELGDVEIWILRLKIKSGVKLSLDYTCNHGATIIATSQKLKCPIWQKWLHTSASVQT